MEHKINKKVQQFKLLFYYKYIKTYYKLFGLKSKYTLIINLKILIKN